MILRNILRKLVLLPIIVALTLIEWCGVFLTGIASTIINLIAVLLVLVAGLSAVMGLASGAECLRMVGLALGGVIVSNLLVLCASIVIAVRDHLIDLL